MVVEPSVSIPYANTVRQVVLRWELHLAAACSLLLSLTALITFWPIPFWGSDIDLATGTVLSIESQSMADRGGLAVGDRILRMYDFTWEESAYQLVLDPLHWEKVTAVPVQVERQGRIVDLNLPVLVPTMAFQVEKLAAFLLAFVFWVTGYALGLIRRHEDHGTPLIAWFWLLLSAVMGLYTFALYESYSLTLLLQWMLCTIILPMSVYIHRRFPPRSVTAAQARRTHSGMIISIACLQVLLFGCVVLFQPTLLTLIDVLNIIVPIGLIMTFVINAGQLWYLHQHIRTAHVQRQLRLLGYALLIVAILWLTLRSIPMSLIDTTLLQSHWLDLLSALIPLAYLAGGTIPDLYRTDRGLRWLTGHLSTAAALLLAIVTLVGQIGWSGPLVAAWMSLAFVVLYRPIYIFGQWLIRRLRSPEPTYTMALTGTKIATTLDIQQFATQLCTGVHAALGGAPIGFYVGDLDGNDILTCLYSKQLNIPDTLMRSQLTEQLRGADVVTESRALARQLPVELDETSTQMIHHSNIALWCPLVHPTRHHLLGVLVLGLRADLDSYRAIDIVELSRLLATAQVALTNSAAYRELAQSEQTIRHLYGRVQSLRDATAKDIAREIHDEVINVNVRLNVQSLRRVLATIEDSRLHEELSVVLQSEETLSLLLRMVCEDLHPTGIDDPVGLPGVLERQLRKISTGWEGQCHLAIEGQPVPVGPTKQREALRIMREACTNAIKHASQATDLWITLRYPTQPNLPISLLVRDNGKKMVSIHPETGKWGVRDMQASAHLVGGSLAFESLATGGVLMSFSFEADPDEVANAAYS